MDSALHDALHDAIRDVHGDHAMGCDAYIRNDNALLDDAGDGPITYAGDGDRTWVVLSFLPFLSLATLCKYLIFVRFMPNSSDMYE